MLFFVPLFRISLNKNNMNISNILDSDLSDSKKIELLLSDAIPTNYMKYCNYYDGEHESLKRTHPTKPNTNLNQYALNYCKQIADFAAYWLLSNPPILINNTPQYEKEFNEFQESWKDSKVEDLNVKLAKILFSETRAAELLYIPADKEDSSVKYMLLSLRNEEFNANFDDKGNMDAFIRKYKVKELEIDTIKEVSYVEVFIKGGYKKYKETAENEYIELNDEITTAYKEAYAKINKIPVVYYSCDFPLFWHIVKLQDRLNEVMCRLSDTNDYFADPKLKLFGSLVKNASGEVGLRKDATGEVIHLQNLTEDGTQVKSDVEYLTWDQVPESTKFEIENLINNILYLTHTPNISFDNLKGIGNLSGVALKLMFLDATLFTRSLKALLFDFQRRINVHKSLLNSLREDNRMMLLDIAIEFQNPIPTNEKEIIETLVQAKTGGILSTETAVENNPFVANTEVEKERLQSDNMESFGSSFDEVPETETGELGNPFINEHSARQKDPSLFEEGSFRRKNIADGIDQILGKLKGQNTMTVQTYRFDKNKFSPAQAKQWLKDHNLSWLSFEEAIDEG